MPDDALDVSKMNVNPGGKQRVMRDGFWNGKVQKINFALGIPKGLRRVLEERGIDTREMNADKMREVLSSHPDYKNEKSRIERFLVEEIGISCTCYLSSTVSLTPSKGYGHKQKSIRKPTVIIVSEVFAILFIRH